MQCNAYEGAEQDGQDDVSSLFRRLGASREASGYRDFTPAALPTRPAPEAPHTEVRQLVAESTSPLTAAVHKLQSTSPSAVQSTIVCTPTSNGLTPLEALFQRLLQANVSGHSGNVLGRLFAR